MRGISGGTALVTGAAGAIGREICQRLAEEGAQVVAADVDGEAAREVAAGLPGEALGVRTDVTDPSGVEELFRRASEERGAVDMVAVNAGVESAVQPVAEFDPGDYTRVFDVNVKGSFLTAASAVRRMRAQPGGGRVVFVASMAALLGQPGVSVYTASKHAVLGMARSLAAEVAEHGIRVNTVCPGVVDTRMMRSLEGGMGAMAGTGAAEVKSGLEQQVPLGRYAQPGEVASGVVWLLSAEAGYAHGEVLTLSGGLAR